MSSTRHLQRSQPQPACSIQFRATITGGNVLVNCPQTAGPGTQFTIDCSGKPGYNSPRWTVNLSAQQTVRLGSFKLVGGIDTQFKSERFVQIQYLPQMLASAEWTTNAQLAFADQDDRWSVTVFVRNIENKRRVTGVQQWGGANTLTSLTTAPRTFGIRAGVKF